MMTKKDIKPKISLSCWNSKTLFRLLCFIFSPFISSQVFQSSGTKIYINSETTVTQNISDTQKKDSAHIYITKGTTLTGLQPNQNITIGYIESLEEPKTRLAKNYSKQGKNVTKHIPKEEKSTLQTETFTQNNNNKTFLLSNNHNTAVAPTTTQNTKLFAFSPKEIKYFHHKSTSQNLNFEKNNISKLSVFLTANNIRPPPFI
jgi:hypothetical protein